MDLSKHISPQLILPQQDVRDKWELLDRMVDALLASPLCRQQPDEVTALIRDTILKREHSMSTGLGRGNAFPHARVPGFSGFAVCLATLKYDLDFAALDGKPIRMACMILVPEENPTLALRVMGALTTLLSDEAVRRYFYSESDPESLYEYLRKLQIDLDISITAREIMRAPLGLIYPATPLRSVARLMHEHHLEAIAVIDNDGRIVGEITCDLLFKKGVPDFFSQLGSVSFIRHFDPFEKYFDEEAHATATQVMSTDFAVVEETATLMEIVYLLSVRNHPKVYVVRDGSICGTIDRIAVLDRILNL